MATWFQVENSTGRPNPYRLQVWVVRGTGTGMVINTPNPLVPLSCSTAQILVSDWYTWNLLNMQKM